MKSEACVEGGGGINWQTSGQARGDGVGLAPPLPQSLALTHPLDWNARAGFLLGSKN